MASGWLVDTVQRCNLHDAPSDDPGEVVPPAPAGADPEAVSLLIADPKKLDLHLSYSAGLERGPIIRRNGMSSPIMEDPDEPGSYTTDPDVQRIGSYFIIGEKKDESLLEMALLFGGNYILYGKLTSLEQAHEQAEQVLLRYLRELRPFPLPPELIQDKFASQIGRLLAGREGFFAHLLEAVHTLLAHRKPWELTDPASAALRKLYATKYPDYLWRDSPELRATVGLNLKKYLRLLALFSQTHCHDEIALRKQRGEIELMQGCGDLTMNEWNVAFVDEEGEWTLLHPPDEPLHDRKYTCLIKWSCQRNNPQLREIADRHGIRIVHPYQIATVQFHGPASTQQGKRPNRHVLLHGQPIGHLIEFAVCGRRVCRGGHVTKLANIVREFSDARHVFKMPNLNPDLDVDEARDLGIEEYRSRPRNLYNESTRNDVWLGETALIQGDRNLRVAALGHSIQLNLRELGAPREWIDLVLKRDARRGYTEVEADADITKAGQWRWVPEGRETWLEIFFLRNQYPCSMIGVQAEDEGPERTQKRGIVDTEYLFFLAHGHKYDRNGCTIRQASQFLLSRGAWDALVFDEGQDVFQLVRDPGTGKLNAPVPLNRPQLRCVFWATEKQEGLFRAL